MRVLGIDPGYGRLGIAVVEQLSGKESLLYSSCLEQAKGVPFDKRLVAIGDELTRVIDKYKPTILAIEKTFFSKNQKTAIAVSEARGVILYIASARELSIQEYTPQEIKVAITGYGKSDKKQVAQMVRSLLALEKDIARDDEYDAIAIGLTCIATVQ